MNADVRKLARRFAVFMVPVVLVVVLIELRLRAMPSVYDFKRSHLAAMAPNVDTVILGSSESLSGLNPEQLSHAAFNLASTSQSFHYDFETLRSMLPKLRALRHVVITVSYFSLFYELSDSPEDWRAYFYLKYYGIPGDEHGRLSWFDPRRYSYVARYGVFESLKYLRRSRARIELSERGWEDNGDSHGDTGDAAGEQRAAFHNDLAKLRHYEDNVARLVRFVDELRGRGIEPVFITLPVHPSYYIRLKPELVAVMRATVASLAIEKRIRYLDLLVDQRFVEDDFLDVNHLNARGAAKASRLLDAALAPGS